MRKLLAISIVFLGAVWFEFGLSKGRFDVIPLIYLGLGAWLRHGRGIARAVPANIIAGLLATVLLGVLAGFGVSMDGELEGGRRVLMTVMFIWCSANTVVLVYMARTDAEHHVRG